MTTATRPARDWSNTVWPAFGAAVAAGFAVPELIAYSSDPDAHPERITLSRASDMWLSTPARRFAFVAACSAFPWVFLRHLRNLSERKAAGGC